MAIKYIECNWDKKLMYVLFQDNKQQYKWYPKWTDVNDLLSCSYSTEVENGGKLNPLFGIFCIEILIELVFNNKEFQHNNSIYKALHDVKQSLLDKSYIQKGKV